MEETRETRRQNAPPWLAAMKTYERADTVKAVAQIVNTLLPYAALWALMIVTVRLGFPYWVTLLLTVPAAGLLVRTFIFFHDCCHGSFLPSSTANRVFGAIAGIITFTPFAEFRYTHGVHHATAGDLDRRGVGDVWTMTVAEYKAAPRLTRLQYRLFRHPLVMFVLGPVFTFFIVNRVPKKGSGARQVRSVMITNLGITACAVAIGFSFGWDAYLGIQLPILMFGGMAGIWLFYVQHQFDPTYWARHEEWGSVESAMQGSSYYKLPKVLQWMTGNIGLHHVHHLKPRIPNYHLQACLDAIPELQLPDFLSLGRSFGSIGLNLWDEERALLIGFGQLRRLRPAQG
jgi:acyl-lipid omega-6 desaturase (Delta-12 desaturase)